MESQKENRTNKHEETKTPTAVNWHCFKACNYACEFCYARFENLKATPVMAANEGSQLLEMLASAGVEKINSLVENQCSTRTSKRGLSMPRVLA